MSNGKVILSYSIFTVFNVVVLGQIFHHPIAYVTGGLIVIIWWIIAALFGNRILLWSIKAAPLNVAIYAEIAKIITSYHTGPKMGTPSLWLSTNFSPMILSIGLSPRSSHILVTRGFLDRLDDKVHLGLITRELHSIRSGLTSANTGIATLLWFILLPGKIASIAGGKEPGEPSVQSTLLNIIPALVAYPFALIGSERKKTYEVDREGSELLENADYMPWAFLQLSEEILKSPYNCELPLMGCCAINPNSKDPYAAFFKLHPPTPKRIDRLRARFGSRRR